MWSVLNVYAISVTVYHGIMTARGHRQTVHRSPIRLRLVSRELGVGTVHSSPSELRVRLSLALCTTTTRWAGQAKKTRTTLQKQRTLYFPNRAGACDPDTAVRSVQTAERRRARPPPHRTQHLRLSVQIEILLRWQDPHHPPLPRRRHRHAASDSTLRDPARH